MGNTKRMDKLNKDSLEKYTGHKHFSNKNLEKEQRVDHCTTRNFYNGKTHPSFSNKNEKETFEKIAQPENTSTKNAFEANTTEIYSYFSDCNLSEWQQVNPKIRKRNQKNTDIPKDSKPKFRQNFQQERLKFSEQHIVNFNEGNSQLVLNSISDLKAKSFTSKNNYSNRIITNKNFKKDFLNIDQIEHDKWDRKRNIRRNEKPRAAKQLKSNVKVQENKSGNLDLSAEACAGYLAVNSKCQFKNTGAIPKKSRHNQTPEQVSDKTSDHENPENQNFTNKTKKHELKQRSVNKDLKPELSNLEKLMASNKTCKKCVKDIAKQTQFNGYLETISTNPKPYNQIEENLPNLKNFHRKANLNVEKLDDNDVYQHSDCSSDLTKENENINRNAERLGDTSYADGVYQHNACTSNLRNENETMGRNVDSNKTITSAHKYQYRAPHSYFYLPPWPMSILPLHEYITNSMFKQQFERHLACEVPGQRFDNVEAFSDMNLNRFQNTNYDETQSNAESTVNEKDSENVTNANQNFNGFAFPNVELNCVQYEPFVIELTYKGQSYYQKIDFSPVQYQCIYCPFIS